MRVFKGIINFSLVFVFLVFSTKFLYSKNAPNSFADLAEKLMPSVVNIASTQTVQTTSNPFPFAFPKSTVTSLSSV